MSNYKEKHGVTRVGKFLKGLQGVAPGLLKVAGTLTGIKGLNKLAKVIKNDPSVSETDKEVVLELIKLDIAEAQEITKRWEVDMKSDSWLSKNIRPLVVANFTLLIDAVIISSMAGKDLGENYLPILMTMGLTAIGGYFTLREYGKSKR